jgi:hypothetical protein
MAKPRDYAKEYREYQGTPAQLHNQSLRHQARREYQKLHPGVNIKGMDIDHHVSLDKGGNPLTPSNLRVEPVKYNRGWRHRKDKDEPTYGK